MFNFERNEIRDPSFWGGGQTQNSYPRFALLNWHCWSTFDLSQILVSSDTQWLSKPELMTHPQSLLGLSTKFPEFKLNYLNDEMVSRSLAALTKVSKLIFSSSLRASYKQNIYIESWYRPGKIVKVQSRAQLCPYVLTVNAVFDDALLLNRCIHSMTLWQFARNRPCLNSRPISRSSNKLHGSVRGDNKKQS